MENKIVFFELSSDELTIWASIIAIAISKELNLDQINILGNFLAAVGTLMTTIAAQEVTILAEQEKKEKEKQAEDVQKQIKEIQEIIHQILENNKL
jgi:hypothetical protein